MADLNCELSPLVFAELYRLLATNPKFENLLHFRLEEIGYALDWVEEASDAYRNKWEYDLQFADATNVSGIALQQPDHGLLATWLLAGLRNSGHCYELSSSLATNILETATRALADLPLPLPPVLSPTVVGWTLGKLVGRYDLPAVPAHLPSNDNVRAAFLGFVEHVLLLLDMPEPWPEMMCTAAYWRGYGLAEGMLPELGSGGPALRQLLVEAQLSMERSQYVQLHRHFEHFNKRRQAVSHIADDPSRPGFVEVIGTIKGWGDLRMTVQGMTQFVYQEVSKELAELPVPSAIRRDPWAHLFPELETW